MTLLGYLLILIMGLTLGLLGGGGSILTVPILVYVFKFSAVKSTAYSLFIVGLSSLFGAFRSYKDGNVNIKVALMFALPGFLGVFLTRAFVVPNIPEILFETSFFTMTKDLIILLTFSLMMIAASFPMILGRKNMKKTSYQNSNMIIPIEGLTVGALTGFVGAGGGFLIVPALVLLSGLKIKEAVGTSLMIISIKSLFGFTGDVMSLPNIDWAFLALMSLISVLGLLVGNSLNKKVNEKKLKKGFGYFVLIMGIFILLQQILSN